MRVVWSGVDEQSCLKTICAHCFTSASFISSVAENVWRIDSGDRSWLVLFGDRSDRAAAEGVVATACCACVEVLGGEPVRGWW